jgi:hypothetical protein
LIAFLLCALAAAGLIWWTDGLLAPAKRSPIGQVGGFTITTNVVQWVAIAIGAYCSFSWLQSIRLRDRPTAALIGNPTFAALSVAGGLMSFASYGISPFLYLYAAQASALDPRLVTSWAGSRYCRRSGHHRGRNVGGCRPRMHPAGRIYWCYWQPYRARAPSC